jgi:hypothetical protein
VVDPIDDFAVQRLRVRWEEDVVFHQEGLTTGECVAAVLFSVDQDIEEERQ